MKKTLTLVLALLMAVSVLAGCGENNDVPENTIRVGNCGPLTGSYAIYGNAVRNGLELAFQEINAKGDLQFALKVEDDEDDGEKAVNSYNNLMDWGMQIMAGPTTSGCALSVAPECAADQVFMLTPSATDAKIIASGDNVFQICFSDPNQGLASAEYISSHNLAEKVGIIYDSSNSYSTGICKKFTAEAETLNLTVACVEAFTSDNKADLSTQVTKCQKAGCDLVFLPIYTTEATQVLTYASKIGYAPKFFGCDGFDGILDVSGFDTALAEGILLLTPFDANADDEATRTFVKKYTEAYGSVPNQFAADAYDVGYAIYEACKAAGVTADMSHEQVCQLLVRQMTTMTFNGLTGKDMTWGTDGAVSKLPMAVVIKDGVYVGAE